MRCKIDGCDRGALYKAQQVCQKHYFRFMRYGTYELTASPAKYRTSNPAGYQLLHEPDHPLSDSTGRVYEHRFVYYNANHSEISNCSLCDCQISWDDCHIDHKDCDITNNHINNLRATCAPCNVFRGHSPISMGKMMLTVDGVTMSVATWARMDGVCVSGGTIKRRKMQGMSDYDSIYAPRKTHQSTKTKKYKAKYDDVRGIGCP